MVGPDPVILQGLEWPYVLDIPGSNVVNEERREGESVDRLETDREQFIKECIGTRNLRQ